MLRVEIMALQVGSTTLLEEGTMKPSFLQVRRLGMRVGMVKIGRRLSGVESGERERRGMENEMYHR